MFTQETLRLAVNFVPTESPKITQSKCWNYFKAATQAGGWVNMAFNIFPFSIVFQ